MPTHNIPPDQMTVRKGLTAEEFLQELAKGSQFEIDLDPRVDFTKPIMEQVLRLDAEDRQAFVDAPQQARPDKAA